MEKVGDGVQGEVWRALDESGREVAVKFFFGADSAARPSIVQSISTLAHINHPNVVPLHAIDEVSHPESGEQVVCAIMGFAPGDMLAHWLLQELFTKELARTFILQLLDGVKAFHAKRAHGDLHDRNVKFDGTNVYLYDPVDPQ